jgi:hypothetical protein
VVESVALGLGYAALLIWGGSALVAAFSPYESYPYWPAIPHLRTDTSGVLAFLVSLVCLTVSKYLELRRRAVRGDVQVKPAVRPAGVLAVQAVAEAAVVCATGLVVYLSLNAVVHPWTLRLQLTHLLPWPSEGTVRVIGLAVCLAAVATRHYLRAAGTRPSSPAASGSAASDAAATESAATESAATESAATESVPAPEAERDRVAVPPGWPVPEPASNPWQGTAGR